MIAAEPIGSRALSAVLAPGQRVAVNGRVAPQFGAAGTTRRARWVHEVSKRVVVLRRIGKVNEEG